MQMDNTLAIQQHYISWIDLRCWDKLWRIILVGALSFALKIVVYNLLFIASYDIFNERLFRMMHQELQLAPQNGKYLWLELVVYAICESLTSFLLFSTDPSRSFFHKLIRKCWRHNKTILYQFFRLILLISLCLSSYVYCYCSSLNWGVISELKVSTLSISLQQIISKWYWNSFIYT